ncbi:MAG: hypothetical protein B6241_03900 [Spirochaetaceae bacterium 4572_59]|nr:MAG: hypothetical protein B6241_03900 [Spirochaetaceae bacterium 4572_59]
MNDIEKRLIPELCQKMHQDIQNAGGNEVLWSGKINEDGVVYQVFVASRGHESATPAIPAHMEKGDVVIHNHPSAVLTPSEADLYQASMLGNNGIGFYIINNDVTRLYAVVEPIQVKIETPLDESFTTGILSPDGPLSKIFDQYEERPSQIELLRLITQGFNEEKLVVAEAGTGVGKSFAYLIPALLWAQNNEQRIVISTATINLQQQIMEKDLPMAKELTGTDVKVVLVKGRRNYICYTRLQEALEEDALFRDEDDELYQLNEWAKTSTEGSINYLPVLPDEILWSKVCSEADSCLGPRCANHARCFVMKARREAASAAVLVVNHHLFFADLSLRINGMGFDGSAVLPPFHKIIFDEAHNIENSASSFFSGEFSRIILRKFLSRLFRQKRGRSSGVLIKVEQFCPPPEDFFFTGKIRELNSQIQVLDALAFDYRSKEKTIRIKNNRDPDYQQSVLSPLQLTREKLKNLLVALSKWYDFIEEKDKEHPASIEFKMLINRISRISAFLDKFCNFDGEDDENIYWLEKRVKNGKTHVRFIVTPLDISSWMRSGIYDSYGTAVFTSATLTMDHKFKYWLNRVGMQFQDEERLVKGQFASPFPYRSNVLLGLPDDIPEPSDENFKTFLPGAVKNLLEINEGRALVLFTSYEMLRSCYEAIQADWNYPDINLIRQGSDDRSRLLKQFSQDEKSVLFATDSFWEGVDTPGDSLRLVIICKLPFRVPTDPVYQARLEAIEKRGGNSFRELSLPEAVMKFRQGFGRLMRRKTDRGSVVVLDSRIVRKNYGTLFIRSLPETIISRKSFSSMLEDLENFIYL